MRIQSQFPWKDHDCNIEKTTIFAKVILSTLSLLFIDIYTTTMPIVAANCKSSKQNHLVSSICPLNKESCQSWGLAAPQHSSWDDDNNNHDENKAGDDNERVHLKILLEHDIVTVLISLLLLFNWGSPRDIINCARRISAKGPLVHWRHQGTTFKVITTVLKF